MWEEGLKPPPDRELVLAATPELAKKLGRRRAPDPILVTVQAQAAARRGLSFTGYGEGLYLAPALPRDLLQLPPPPQAPEKPKAGKTPTHGPHPRQLRPGPARDAAARGQTPVQRQEGRAGLEGRDPGPAETEGKRRKGERAKRLRSGAAAMGGHLGTILPVFREKTQVMWPHRDAAISSITRWRTEICRMVICRPRPGWPA